mgnify:CR=1 FL=1
MLVGLQWPVLSDKVEATRTFAQPIVDAFYLEGSYHIKPPCYSNPPSSKCQVGSPWIVQAQEWMGGSKAADITWECTNQFHPVWKIPFVRCDVLECCMCRQPAPVGWWLDIGACLCAAPSACVQQLHVSDIRMHVEPHDSGAKHLQFQGFIGHGIGSSFGV